jgi:caa(3)-type oxidase subunit IV
VTVAVAFIDMPVWMAIAVALFIASVKGSLVACYFMHLISEKKLIFMTLIFTVIFFAGLLLLPVFTSMDAIEL